MKLYLTRLNIGFWLANIVISSVDWAALSPSISTVKDWSYYLIYIGLHIRWTHACPPKPEPFASWFSSIHIYVYIHIPNLFIYLLISYTNIDTNVYIYIPIQVSGIFPYIRLTFNEKHLPTPPLSMGCRWSSTRSRTAHWVSSSSLRRAPRAPCRSPSRCRASRPRRRTSTTRQLGGQETGNGMGE